MPPPIWLRSRSEYDGAAPRAECGRRAAALGAAAAVAPQRARAVCAPPRAPIVTTAGAESTFALTSFQSTALGCRLNDLRRRNGLRAALESASAPAFGTAAAAKAGAASDTMADCGGGGGRGVSAVRVAARTGGAGATSRDEASVHAAKVTELGMACAVHRERSPHDRQAPPSAAEPPRAHAPHCRPRPLPHLVPSEAAADAAAAGEWRAPSSGSPLACGGLRASAAVDADACFDVGVGGRCCLLGGGRAHRERPPAKEAEALDLLGDLRGQAARADLTRRNRWKDLRGRRREVGAHLDARRAAAEPAPAPPRRAQRAVARASRGRAAHPRRRG